MTKQRLQNGDSVEVTITEAGVILLKYDKTGKNITNKTCVSLGKSEVKLPFLCLTEKGGYCVVWLQEASHGFGINIRKYTGLGLASKITAISTENVPDGNLLNVILQNSSLLTIEWSSHKGMFSGVFNIDGSIHTKESIILHKTESLQEDVGKPTQENIRIEIIDPKPSDQNTTTNEKERFVRPPVIKVPSAPIDSTSTDVSLPVQSDSSIVQPQQQQPAQPQQPPQQLLLIPQTPRRSAPMKYIANNTKGITVNPQQAKTKLLNMNTQPTRRGNMSMGMRFM